MPARTPSRVDLPAPFGPSTATVLATVRERDVQVAGREPGGAAETHVSASPPGTPGPASARTTATATATSTRDSADGGVGVGLALQVDLQRQGPRDALQAPREGQRGAELAQAPGEGQDAPESSPGSTSGRVTRRSTSVGAPPSVAATASYVARPCAAPPPG